MSAAIILCAETLIIGVWRAKQRNGYSKQLFSNDTETIAVATISDKGTVIYGLGRCKGEMIRFVNKGGAEFLWYSGYPYHIMIKIIST